MRSPDMDCLREKRISSQVGNVMRLPSAVTTEGSRDVSGCIVDYKAGNVDSIRYQNRTKLNRCVCMKGSFPFFCLSPFPAIHLADSCVKQSAHSKLIVSASSAFEIVSASSAFENFPIGILAVFEMCLFFFFWFFGFFYGLRFSS